MQISIGLCIHFIGICNVFHFQESEKMNCDHTNLGTFVVHLINYRPQRSWAKVISLQACVCPHGGGVPGLVLGGCLKFPGGAGCLKFSGGV